jgi:selenocysteine-specific translation elongation factor
MGFAGVQHSRISHCCAGGRVGLALDAERPAAVETIRRTTSLFDSLCEKNAVDFNLWRESSV